MSTKYKLLKDYKGFPKGAVITVAAPSRFRDMNKGYGELYVEPKPKAKPKTKSVASPPKDKMIKTSIKEKE